MRYPLWATRFLIAVCAASCGDFGVSTTVAAADAVIVPSPVTAPNTWPQWRGGTRDGQVPADTRWPAEITDSNLKPLLQIEKLGPSYSGPIVSETAVFLTETRGKKSEWVTAYNRQTGDKLWERNWVGSLSVPFFAKANGDWIRSTPAFDGANLYVGGIRDVLVSLDAASGNVNWKVDFVEKFKTPLPAFGFVCSPLVDGDALYVQAANSLVRLNKNNGEVVWRSMVEGDGMMGSAFSSPVICQIGDKRLVLVQTRSQLAGVDPETGDVAWKMTVEAFRGMNVLTPTLYKDSIFTSSYGGKSLLLSIPQTAGPEVKPGTLWSMKQEGYMSSPIVVGDAVYMHLRNQRFTCLDLKTGKDQWTTQPFGKYWSMVCQGDRILALDATEGNLILIQATPEKYTEISKKKVTDSECWAHVAVVGSDIFVRDLESLKVFRWSDK